MSRRLVAFTVCLVLSACGGESNSAIDAGSKADAGVTTDAGNNADAGVTTDAGNNADAGGESDAGTTCDGYVDGEACKPFRTCAPGTFVSKEGTSATDRECTPCEPGSFSSADNAPSCTTFTTCDVVETEGTDTTDRVCAYDCEIDWSDWSCCGNWGGGPVQMRTGTVTKPASAHGSCTSVLAESRGCVPDAPHCPCDTRLSQGRCTTWDDCTWDLSNNICIPTPIDCEYTVWSAWSMCSADCDIGTQTRTRTIVHEAANGGKPCNDPLEVTQQCNRLITCQCSQIPTEQVCDSYYAGCNWNNGTCEPVVIPACDSYLTETDCNAHLDRCEWMFESCVPH